MTSTRTASGDLVAVEAVQARMHRLRAGQRRSSLILCSRTISQHSSTRRVERWSGSST